MAAITPDTIRIQSMGDKKLTIGSFVSTTILDGDTWATGIKSAQLNLIFTMDTGTGGHSLRVDAVSSGTLTFNCDQNQSDFASTSTGTVFIISDDY